MALLSLNILRPPANTFRHSDKTDDIRLLSLVQKSVLLHPPQKVSSAHSILSNRSVLILTVLSTF
jgi:phosphoserine phosphatase